MILLDYDYVVLLSCSLLMPVVQNVLLFSSPIDVIEDTMLWLTGLVVRVSFWCSLPLRPCLWQIQVLCSIPHLASLLPRLP